MLSICIGHRARTAVPYNGTVLPIFPRAVEALAAAVKDWPHKTELLVAHWPTPDEPAIETWLPQVWGGDYRILTQTGPFTRGGARNAAAKAAQYKVLFFMDTDMLVSPGVLRRGAAIAERGQGYFPLYRFYVDATHTVCAWGAGHGNCFVLKKDWEAAGGFQPLAQWGKEDTAFARWFVTHKRFVQERHNDFFHQFHLSEATQLRANYSQFADAMRDTLAAVAGDVAEIGVWTGGTCIAMAQNATGRTVHAVDSFQGMGEPTAKDRGQYHAKALSVGGSASFRQRTAQFGEQVVIHEGWIPAVLEELAGCRFAFVHLDVDHYLPTLQALRFVWPRLAPGGMVYVHDWFPERDYLASQAVHEWMAETGVALAYPTATRHAVFRKGADDAA